MTWTIRQRSSIGPLAAITAGEGPVVLLIHGVGLRAEAWGAQIDALSQTCRLIAVDMPGHGASAALPARPSLVGFVDAIAGVLDQPAVVVGHSFGAMIGLDMAIRHPTRVKGVAALNAIYRRDAAAQAAVMARAGSLDGATTADPTATLERWFGAHVTPQRMACDGWLRMADPAGYRAAYRVFASHNGPATADLSALHCPALFMTGADEPNSTPAMSREMADLAPNGRAEIIADAAHMAPMTHPARVNTVLSDFIRGCT
ncbi:alpha/beta hydrolase [uncultured Sulfitobacter sp.]|uniref:alpha/beta fold hydrolase n=1 Tax=uncultured Sulfitobacter sp. TaxID=191468 RepID=UPI00261D5180|nr:alpha/beta hydrolase [uncultured Sulfitobacter sp.]